ncbi:Lcl domain-containing protein [Flavobacterium luteum]|uniref:DUF1566 domain-containing protein n=1 Tax=Flavobacterium luteum TaxID=2026654 RepID=A0A7J5AKC9_9FLAO|nr:DUF1566 domain-containing protein [Flavobacterium luteum]KAB1157953.1 DUF1566 domain-containing protein [Flavobacterium luteum]
MKKLNLLKIIIFLITIHFISCTNEFDYGKIINAVKTLEFSNVTQTTANVSGNIITDNGASITSRGICYGIDNNPTISGPKKLYDTAELGNFTCTIDNLEPSTTYYARAYATNSYGTAYGVSITFTTLKATVPIISSTTAANLVTATTAKTGGIITNSGASNVISRGVCYSSTSAVPTIANSKTNNGTGIGSFISLIDGLTPNTIYYIRAYATNGIGTAYGDVKSFSTTTATIPTGIITTTASAITLTSASSGGTISNDGGASITSRGICWSTTTTSPTIVNTKSINGSGVGAYTSALTSLTPGTTYYVRAYATNNVGTAYGNTIAFNTIAATIPNGITTNSVSSITQNSSICGGNINTDGGATITSRGVCYSNTNSNPNITNTKTIDGTGIGAFSSSLTSLSANKTYYVRAYATNGVGTAYGTTRTFVTSSATIPTGISTTSISSISQNTANSGGTITSDGGAAITSRGICWSNTNSNPTISNTKTTDGSSIGSFNSSMSGLLPGVTYYVRAYATNSLGTAYGPARTFSTLVPAIAVGQSYQGGIIAYIFQSGDSGYISGQIHGIITPSVNQSAGVTWGCSGNSIGTSTFFGTGQSNTTSIINSCLTSNTAARICYNLSFGGYTDWYLPSYFELEKLYINRSLIGGFNNVSYWSSSQYNSTNAYGISFTTGATISSTKTSSLYVRAIRKF